MIPKNENEHEPLYDTLNGDALYELAKEAKDDEQKIRLLKLAAEKGHNEACYELYLLVWFDLDSDSERLAVFSYLEKAADNGHLAAQYELGDIYYYGDSPKRCYPSYDDAIYYYELALSNALKEMQTNGSNESVTVCLMACQMLVNMYLKGEGTTIREAKSFDYAKILAYRHFPFMGQGLADFYIKGLAVEPNIDEAYIWALIYQSHFKKLTKEIVKLFRKMKSSVTTKHRVALQEEAARRNKIMKERPLTDEDVAEFVLSSTQATEIQSTEPVANKAPEHITNSNIEMDDVVDIESIETSNIPVFKHIDQVRKGFDPNKIKIKLVADEAKNDKDTPDFKYFVFSYGNYYDKKSIDVFATEDFKIHLRVRKLLIKLAIQYSVKDAELSKQNIATVIKRHVLDPTIISCLNKLMLHVFPKCFKTTQSNMIDRKDGRLKIKIYFHDIWNIELCKDYDDLKRV